MSDRWFRVPTETIDEIDGPKYRDKDGLTGFSGNTIAESLIWVVRFYGDTATLDEIANKPQVSEVTSKKVAETLMNAGSNDNLPDKDWTAEQVNESFKVSN